MDIEVAASVDCHCGDGSGPAIRRSDREPIEPEYKQFPLLVVP
jgi:hypothetical protein